MVRRAGTPPHVALAVHVQAASGCRISEASRLELADCDLRAGIAILGRHQGGAKTGPRRVPLPSDLCTLLAQHAEPNGPIGGNPRTVEKSIIDQGRRKNRKGEWVDRPGWISKACAALEIPRFTSHDIRRMVVSHSYRSGVNIKAAAKLLGHSEKEALKAYGEATDLDVRQVAEQVWKRPRGQLKKVDFGG